MSESTRELYRRVTEQITSVPLSQLLPSILTLARRLNDSNLENWVRLEMGGYLKDNPAMNEDIVVPKYRTIAGRRSDEFGRPFVINDSRLHFINEERIRSGVAELEHLAKGNKMLTVHTPEANRIIEAEFGVEVTQFTFHPSSISGVLSNIRSKILDWLDEIQPDIDQLITSNQEANIIEEVMETPNSQEKRTAKPIVFISYSHKDEKEKEQLVAHLKVLEIAGLIELWIDDRIEGGADWQEEIKQAIAQSSVAILLISANFLTSDFILGKEIPEFLNHRQGKGLNIFPIIAKACHWEVFDWLVKMNVRPKNGAPVWRGNKDEIDQRLTIITKEIRSIVEKKAGRNLVPIVVTTSNALSHTPKKKPLTVGDDREDPPGKAKEYFSPGFAAFMRGDYGEARRYFSMVLEIDPHYPNAEELLDEAKHLYWKEKFPFTPRLLLDKLRDPVWGGIAAVATILAVVWSVYIFVIQTPAPTPTSVPVIDTPTEIATSAEKPTVTSPSTATNTLTPSPTPSNVTHSSSPPTYSGNLAIPLISGLDSKVYLTGFNGQGINGPNPVSVDAQQPMFSWDGRSILVKATIAGKSGIHQLTASGFNPELSIERPSAAWPVLSPDGQTVMFSETTLDFRLHIKKPDETIEEVPLNNLFISAKNLLWSEDNQLVFQGCAIWLNEPDTCGIWITNANNLAPQRIIDNKEAYPMSARVGWLAYMYQEDGDWEVYVMPLGGGAADKLTDNGVEDGLPVISPNGDGIAYISNESGSWALWTMNLDGQNKERRFDIDPGRGTIDINQWKNERMSWRR